MHFCLLVPRKYQKGQPWRDLIRIDRPRPTRGLTPRWVGCAVRLLRRRQRTGTHVRLVLDPKPGCSSSCLDGGACPQAPAPARHPPHWWSFAEQESSGPPTPSQVRSLRTVALPRHGDVLRAALAPPGQFESDAALRLSQVKGNPHQQYEWQRHDQVGHDGECHLAVMRRSHNDLLDEEVDRNHPTYQHQGFARGVTTFARLLQDSRALCFWQVLQLGD